MADEKFRLVVNGEVVFETPRPVRSASFRTVRGEVGKVTFLDDPIVNEVFVAMDYEGTLVPTLRQQEKREQEAMREHGRRAEEAAREQDAQARLATLTEEDENE